MVIVECDRMQTNTSVFMSLQAGKHNSLSHKFTQDVCESPECKLNINVTAGKPQRPPLSPKNLLLQELLNHYTEKGLLEAALTSFECRFVIQHLFFFFASLLILSLKDFFCFFVLFRFGT
ncbi:hypothetical protein XENOCAPTIV_010650 [Xenoophorus captivus]|uniref:LisH domain-containing protein n=1 Tax=Xenoophorus captivus TaxID=1517983 RepID=A0ABV0S914_9TELE